MRLKQVHGSSRRSDGSDPHAVSPLPYPEEIPYMIYVEENIRL